MTRIFVFPGQGSQHKGMGTGLFQQFPELTAAADAELGYSVEKLCRDDPYQKLTETAYTQPSLYIVNALSYLKRVEETGEKPDFVAGHSLGEYNALFAAGAFDFVIGLKLVKKRGELMSQATGGGMAAIVGLGVDQIRDVLRNSGLDTVDIANLNAPDQTVISGLQQDVQAVRSVFEEAGARMFIPLKVGAAFHSRYMKPARNEFEGFLQNFEFLPIQIPVISNAHAAPYEPGQIKENLCKQITHSVCWTESVQYLLNQPNPEFEEIGPGNVLTGLIRRIRAKAKR